MDGIRARSGGWDCRSPSPRQLNAISGVGQLSILCIICESCVLSFLPYWVIESVCFLWCLWNRLVTSLEVFVNTTGRGLDTYHINQNVHFNFNSVTYVLMFNSGVVHYVRSICNHILVYVNDKIVSLYISTRFGPTYYIYNRLYCILIFIILNHDTHIL